jgi:Peptidase family M1 domain
MRIGVALASIALSALAAQAAHAAPVAIRGADPEAYTLDLRYLQRGPGLLQGSERIEFTNRGPRPLARVWLRLWANGPDRCRPRRIDVRIDAPATAGRARCSALEVRLGSPVAPGATGSLSLRFEVRGRRPPDRFGRIGGTTLFGNVIPVLAVEDDRGLHLERYTAIGESFYSLAARWSATVRLPARLAAATTGAVVSEGVTGSERTIVVESAQARDFALAVGRLRTIEANAGAVRVRVHFGPGVGGVRRNLRVARRAVRALGRRLGPYPSRELDVVLLDLAHAGDGFAGMEYPELVFSLPFPEVVTHEVAHQWWYGLVGNDQYREPWLDESFAQYSHERLHPGVNTCRPRRPYRLVHPSRRRIPLDASMRIFDRSPAALGEVVYLAGSCALQRLERDIGRRRMTAVLRRLQARFRHGVMRKSDVLAAIRDVAPRYRLRRWMRLAHLSA